MSRPIRSSSGLSASIRVLISSFNWLMGAWVTDMLANNCMAMAERSNHLKARMQVRTTVAQGQMPTLQQVAESANDLVPPDASLAGLRFFRDSGTEIGLGYATGREPTVWMTNGSNTAAVKTVAEIRSRYLEGWDFGTAAHPGVRIHIPNSRTEKILEAAQVFIRLSA